MNNSLKCLIFFFNLFSMGNFGSEEVKWRYQIIDHGTPEQPNCCVHEVYFETETKRIVSHTLNPVALDHYESKQEMIEILEMILADVRKQTVLNVSDIDKDVFRK